jgi:hypothetical protein
LGAKNTCRRRDGYFLEPKTRVADLLAGLTGIKLMTCAFKRPNHALPLDLYFQTSLGVLLARPSFPLVHAGRWPTLRGMEARPHPPRHRPRQRPADAEREAGLRRGWGELARRAGG